MLLATLSLALPLFGQTPGAASTKGTFEITTNLDSPAPAAKDPAIGRLSLNKKFSGGLDGTSNVEMLTAVTSVKGSAVYVAIEKFTGKLDGHSGTFVMQHSGSMRGGSQVLDVRVVPDSATGDLTGLSGKMNIRIENGKHYYDFAYSLPK